MSFLESVDIEEIKNISILAGNAIMHVYKDDFAVEYKKDDSPLTQADVIANKIICSKLKALYPNIPILSEENDEVPYEIRKNWEYYWCIDPLDGTRQFVKKNGEFTVNIALIYKNQPVLGVVHAPALKKLYYAKKNNKAFLEILNEKDAVLIKSQLPIIINNNKQKNLRVVVSNSRTSDEMQKYIEELKNKTQNVTILKKGSSLKLCMVAQGSADMAICLYDTCEWDTAAAHAVVLEVKKDVVQYENKNQLIYNKKDLLNDWFVMR